MITKEDLQALNEFMASIKTPGLKLVCMDCKVQLEGSDPSGSRTSHGLCPQCHAARMAELRKEAA